MKKLLRAILCMILGTLMLCSSAASLVSSADGSHGFYMSCDASVADDKSDGFMIDFYSDSADALCTYWSNANWSMYTLPSIKKLGYHKLTGGGAYAGLQIRGSADDHAGIMSMWKYDYVDKKTGEAKSLYAKALYGKTTTYDNEGSGTSCVMPYDWKNDQWYRELLYCWTDEETGYTFIGTWFYDYEAEKWTLFAYYNTFLVDSYIKGDIGQFLENYWESYRDRYRSFRYRNIYFLPHGEEEWVGSPAVTLRSDGNPKAHGEAKLGVSEDKTYIWGSVDGGSAVDTDEEIRVSDVLKQDKTPALGTPEIASFTLSGNAKSPKASWAMTEKSTPQLSYKVVVTDSSGKELAKKSGTRPEVTSVDLGNLGTDDYKCEITVTDVFGKSTTASYLSENYGKTPVEPSKPTPSHGEESSSLLEQQPSGEQTPSGASLEVSESSKEEKIDESGSLWAQLLMIPYLLVGYSLPIVVISLVALAVCGGVILLVWHIKRKKKK